MKKRSHLLRRGQPGFSLVELVIAVAIVGLLASAAMPMVELKLKREKESGLRSSLRDIRKALDAYKAAASAGRIRISPGGSGYPATLADLAVGVEDSANPGGAKLYFLRRIPRDPLNDDPNTASEDTWGKRSFDSPPNAPRDGRDVFDVYSKSPATGMNGIPYGEW